MEDQELDGKRTTLRWILEK